MIRPWFESTDKLFDCQDLAVKLIDLVKNRGGNVDVLLRGTGIFYDDLINGATYISFAQTKTLITNAQRLVTSDDLSFLLGRRLMPNHHPSFSELAMNVRSLGELLRLSRLYQPMFFPYLFISEKQHGDKCYLVFNSAIAETEQNTFLFEVICTCINALCKWHIGHQIPLQFFFQQERPRNIYQFEENLGSRLRFNYPMNMVAIDYGYLNKRLLNSSDVVRLKTKTITSQLRRKYPKSEGLIQHVCRLLSTGKVQTLEDLALTMESSVATVKRKLKQHGTSFQKLQDQVRSQQAIFDLNVRNMSNEQAAASLKFDNLPNFRRAIKRWTGYTPSEFKAKY